MKNEYSDSLLNFKARPFAESGARVLYPEPETLVR